MKLLTKHKFTKNENIIGIPLIFIFILRSFISLRALCSSLISLWLNKLYFCEFGFEMNPASLLKAGRIALQVENPKIIFTLV